MSDIELARISGFFAGEGYIVISGKPVPALYVAVGNTESVWIDLLHKHFAGSRTVQQPKYMGAKCMFRWRVTGKLAVKFLKAIQPFLMGEKLQQLELGLEFQKAKDTYKAGIGNKKCTPEFLATMEAFRERLRNLRRAAAETNRKDAASGQSDSPTLWETLGPVAESPTTAEVWCNNSIQ